MGDYAATTELNSWVKGTMADKKKNIYCLEDGRVEVHELTSVYKNTKITNNC